MGGSILRGGWTAHFDFESVSSSEGSALIVIGNRSAKNVPNLIGLSDARYKTGYDFAGLTETINYC